MKISIVTVTFNRRKTLFDAIRSVREQSYAEIEHVIIDGASTDGSVQLIEDIIDETTTFVSEPDNGVFDALNKGCNLTSGEIIGLMHSDDLYADKNVLRDVANLFHEPSVDLVYGDLQYVDQLKPAKVVRNWRSGPYSRAKLANGWMPPHPTVFVRRKLIESCGLFDTQFRIAADYDVMLRYLIEGRAEVRYLPRVIVKMRVGGQSNKSLSNIIKKSKEDYRIIRKNRLLGMYTLVLKNLRKIPQFFK